MRFPLHMKTRRACVSNSKQFGDPVKTAQVLCISRLSACTWTPFVNVTVHTLEMDVHVLPRETLQVYETHHNSERTIIIHMLQMKASHYGQTCNSGWLSVRIARVWGRSSKHHKLKSNPIADPAKLNTSTLGSPVSMRSHFPKS